MERNLSVEFRPQKLEDFFGNDTLINSIKTGFLQGRIDSTYVIVGAPGTGKTSLARAITHHLNGPLDYYDITEPDTSELDSEELRAMIRRANIRPQWGKYKAFIVDEVQKLRTDVQDILLKATEEPCDSTIWFICSSEPGKINPALRRRGSYCVMEGLTREQTLEFIKKTTARVDTRIYLKHKDQIEEFTDALIQNDVTSPGLIIRGIEKWITGVPVLEAAKVSEVSTIDTFAIAKAAAAGKWIDVVKHIKDAPVSCAKDVRKTVTGYFRKILINAAVGSQRAERSAWAIEQMTELSNQSQFEDGLIWSATVAALYKITAGQKEYIATK